nr:MAG: nucleocapsid protein [Okutama tick virus]WFD55813.1 MAG: nucleocapsid protein [Okutama tick virus]WFD55815.1 MAG: nucleocapsid protein [Okutama tick virus]WFD55817.1 MAG: nucleocapsid protein [Okutama tick virus]WFD55819.1 MAG: nucleocapsid protein [Okutama tick virus]
MAKDEKIRFSGLPVVPDEPTAADWATISHEMGLKCDPNLAAIEELSEMFKYQGMDPAVIIRKFAKLGTLAKRTWLNDAAYLIVLHICRGTQVTKIKKTVTQETAAELETLVNTYQIKEKKPKGDDITLARIALCFPLMTLRQLTHFQEHLTVKHHQMTQISPGYPLQLMHASFASLIPSHAGKQQDALDFLDAHRLFLVELTKVINPDMRGKTVAEIAESFEQPLQAGFGSTFVSHENRVASLRKLGLVTADDSPIDEVRRAAVVYRTRLGAR